MFFSLFVFHFIANRCPQIMAGDGELFILVYFCGVHLPGMPENRRTPQDLKTAGPEMCGFLKFRVLVSLQILTKDLRQSASQQQRNIRSGVSPRPH